MAVVGIPVNDQQHFMSKIRDEENQGAVQSAPGPSAQSFFQKWKYPILFAALACVVVVVVVPSVVVTQQKNSRTSMGGNNIISAGKFKQSTTPPEGSFKSRRFGSCTDMSQSLKFETVTGTTLDINAKISFTYTSSIWNPPPSDYCTYCDCASAPSTYVPGTGGGYSIMPVMAAAESSQAVTSAAAASDSAGGGASSAKATDFTGTNNQVDGVDEADIVKTDGKYMYVLAASNTLVISDVVPLDNAKVISATDTKAYGVSWSEMLISGDSNTLVTMGSLSFIRKLSPYDDYLSATVIVLWDIKNKASPTVIKSIQIEGNYVSARLVKDHVYVVLNTWPSLDFMPMTTMGSSSAATSSSSSSGATSSSNTVAPDAPQSSSSASTMPSSGGSSKPVLRRYPMYRELTGAQSASSASNAVPFESFISTCTSVTAIQDTIMDAWVSIVSVRVSGTGTIGDQSIVTHAGTGNIVYASTDNIYVAGVNYGYARQTLAATRDQLVPDNGMWTAIMKFSLNNGNPAVVATGTAPGIIINQFAMDEFNGNLRVATSIGFTWEGSTSNNVFVLDGNLQLIGQVTGIAPGETIKSVRYAGERGYVVTFRQVDPFYVIDLSNANSPTILGELKVPGFSEYMHPVDKNTIVGIGKDTKTLAASTDCPTCPERVVTTSVKISLFDVTDPRAPKEKAVFKVGDQGTYTPLSQDHKYFTFHKESGTMAFPIVVYTVPAGATGPDAYGRASYDGLYVFKVKDTIDFLGRLTHSTFDFSNTKYYYSGWGDVRAITRSYYMDGTLLSVSQRQIQGHAIAELKPQATATSVAKKTIDMVKPDCSVKPWDNNFGGIVMPAVPLP